MSFKEFHSTIKNLKHIRQFAEQELLKNSVPQNIINEIKIVIGEATANIYNKLRRQESKQMDLVCLVCSLQLQNVYCL